MDDELIFSLMILITICILARHQLAELFSDLKQLIRMKNKW